MSEAASIAVTKEKDDDVFPIFLEPLPLKVRGPKGVVTTYYVHETSGPEDFWKWQVKSDQLAREAEEGKEPSMSYYAHQVDLLCLCIRDAQGEVVNRKTIDSWGMSLKNHAFKLAQKMNGMNREDADKMGKASESEANSGGGTKSQSESDAPSNKPNAT